MAAKAQAAGVSLKIESGFRTLARQEYFWNCKSSLLPRRFDCASL
jgi:hypothetical protein